MSSVSIVRRQKYRSPPPQPLDRHLSEIGELDGSVYINAGIDSTCCKKRSRTIYKLTDGIITSTIKSRNSNGHNDDLSSVSDDDRFDSINNGNCVHCGKK